MKTLSLACDGIQRSNFFESKYKSAWGVFVLLSWRSENLFDPKGVVHSTANTLKWTAVYYIAAASLVYSIIVQDHHRKDV